MTITIPVASVDTTADAWTSFLNSQPDQVKPTHRVRLRIHVDVDVVLEPSMSTYDGMTEVLNAAERMDPDSIFERIDYDLDRFLPAGTKLNAVHADIERL